MSTEIAHRETITAMVGTYQQATADIEQAYKLLASAQGKLRGVFKPGFGSFDVIRRNNPSANAEEAGKVIEDINRQVWRAIMDRLEIRKLLSIKRREELDAQLSGDTHRWDQKPAPLPPITEENILAMFQDAAGKAPEYAREAVYEVFDWLRPHRGHTAALKTNGKWQIGKKAIIGYAVEPGYGKSGPFRTHYGHEKNLIALDNVFHMLDGRGPLKSHYGPLCDAIKQSPDGMGDTDFFRFRCCLNGNLHVEFKRLDLVNKINKMAGGCELKEAA